jgi:hypothetical protein
MAPVPGDSSKHQFGTSMPQGGHPPHHSITSSAATSRPGGTVRPSAFAVLRLIVVSSWSAPAPANQQNWCRARCDHQGVVMSKIELRCGCHGERDNHFSGYTL